MVDAEYVNQSSRSRICAEQCFAGRVSPANQLAASPTSFQSPPPHINALLISRLLPSEYTLLARPVQGSMRSDIRSTQGSEAPKYPTFCSRIPIMQPRITHRQKYPHAASNFIRPGDVPGSTWTSRPSCERSRQSCVSRAGSMGVVAGSLVTVVGDFLFIYLTRASVSRTLSPLTFTGLVW